MNKINKISSGFGHISINYDTETGYKAVKASINFYGEGEDVKRVFSTGDVCSDFFNASTFLMYTDGIQRISMSSSCDHFGMDIEGFSWYENDLFGELICTQEDCNNNWHSYVRQHGKYTGRNIWIQGSRGKNGQFAVIDNVDEVLLVCPNCINQKVATVQEAIALADKLSK